jgi:hypothetical protein
MKQKTIVVHKQQTLKEKLKAQPKGSNASGQQISSAAGFAGV